MSRVTWCLGLALLVACASMRPAGSGALEPRFLAVHNTLAAMGLAQVGPIHEGVLREGMEARVGMDLVAGCTTIVAVGGEGVRDVDAALLDPRGRPLAHDTTNEPQAVLRACVDGADAYVLIVKFASGSGTWVAAAWHGGAPGESSRSGSSDAPSSPAANGTCAAPIPLAPGIVTGSTAQGAQENAGSCDQSDSRELVYELRVPERERVTIEVEARFDSVLYVRKSDCTDPDAEVDCSDDAPDRTHSRIERVLDPGRYFVFVDGYSHDAGAFKMTVTATGVLAFGDVCRHAPGLVAGPSMAGTTAAMANDAEASCGGGAEGADAPWRMDLPVRSRVRIIEHSSDVTPVVHVRRACTDAESEVACGESTAAKSDAVVAGVFDPGIYTVVADAHDRDAAGRYSLQLDVSPPAGSGTVGDTCEDAIPLANGSGAVSGDTFDARDDVSGSCGGASAADVIYRVDVAKRSRFVASLQAEEAPHMLVAWQRCGDRSTEVACGRNVDEVLSPATYFLAVDGASPNALGRFTVAWSLQDLAAQGVACLSARTLVEGSTVTGTTIGAGDKFAVSCAGGDGTASGPDRIYRLPIPRRGHAHIALTSSSFEAAIALRRACADAAGGARTAEILCEQGSDVGLRTGIDQLLEMGTYWVVVDGQTPNDQGTFTLEYHLTK